MFKMLRLAKLLRLLRLRSMFQGTVVINFVYKIIHLFILIKHELISIKNDRRLVLHLLTT